MREPATTRVGGFIRWEFCRSRLGATCKAKRRFANPCYCPKTECLITSAAWPSKALHLDNFDTLFAKSFGKFLSRTVIRDQAPDSVKGTNLRNTSPAQLAEIRDDVDLFRGADHHTIELRFEHVRCRKSVLEVETVDG